MTAFASPATLIARNRFLASLPAPMQQQLVPLLEVFTMPVGTVLQSTAEAMQAVYFPTDSVVSLLYPVNNGAATAILVAGNESVIGLEQLTGGIPPVQAVVQHGGYALYLPVQQLRDACKPGDKLFFMLERVARSQRTRMVSTSHCKQNNCVTQRFCHWLVQSLEHHACNQLSITKQLLACLLGVRRQRISETALRLERLGVIRYASSHITVLSQQQLNQLCRGCALPAADDNLLPAFQAGDRASRMRLTG